MGKFFFDLVLTQQGTLVIDASDYDDAMAQVAEYCHSDAVVWENAQLDTHLTLSTD